ncbi:hypothetical protein R1sor_013342 [Riccia sorocarpa]|uniref:Uncharacterized protein n=1 Tax=Riccia sorocarpa TaxID=122646 RepID=A0ABD3H694_9MARC
MSRARKIERGNLRRIEWSNIKAGKSVRDFVAMSVPWRVSENWRQRRTNVTKVHRECNVCFSSRQTTRLYEPVLDTPNEELVVKTCTYEQLSHMASIAFREASIVVYCSEEYMEALTSWEGNETPRICFKKWVNEVVRPEVEAGSGLYWELRTWVVRLTVRTSSVPQCDAFRDNTECV